MNHSAEEHPSSRRLNDLAERACPPSARGPHVRSREWGTGMDTNDDATKVGLTGVRVVTELRIGLNRYEHRSEEEVWVVADAWIELSVEMTAEASMETHDAIWGTEP